MSGATVKCLVWDLDETLWQGTLLEDGEVRLAEEVRKVVVELDSRGILQSVASRNDHDHAWARLEALGLAEYFVLPQIGWGAKSASVRLIAERLNFAHTTIAFVDDRPAERAEVAFHLPDVRVYPADQVLALLDLPEFTPATSTVDSRRRREMYQAGFRREAERAEASGPDEEFLRSLDLVMRIGRATGDELSRVEELTLRTSQMNATGVHYPDAVLRSLIADPDHEVLVVTLTDRFGPHGAVGVVLLERHPQVWHLKLLATSCRVVSYGVGATLLSWLADEAARAGVHLVADFRPTDRNRMMEIAYRFAGFDDQTCPCTVRLSPTDAPGSTAGAASAEPTRTDGLQRLHLVPTAQAVSATIRLDAPDLGTADR
ncbi:HAD-IIIC family phosphatase [Streptacidiphilus sp. PB12-B1b]|uniref:HAD-IIIC family phosphatase n=1 Tax=Streptacidiphilus sp. PB12-B1b TaxID=2705012 RepID=UPI0015FE118C|nr:HAD-IIIC family phosphatase [Streptacidiphilus sp. PB12-B1b]QMU77440.1 HAD-IIIC family phosphatase [Streptacidiphilus sp. PB12-B1b]